MLFQFLADKIFLIAIYAVLFAAVVVIAWGLYGIFSEKQQMQRRLEVSQGPGQEGSESSQIVMDDSFLGGMSGVATPSDLKEINEIRLRLTRAGFRKPSAVRVYHLIRALTMTILPVLCVSLIFFSKIPLPITVAIIFLSLLMGFLLPSLTLDHLIKRRKNEAESGFPDVLDLLLVCIEAGQGFDQASRRIAREMKISNKVLAEEFTILNDELWAGKDRGAVFRDFATRVDVPDITAFVAVLRQADQFGVSIGDAIRIYASDMRYKRVMRAEEKANAMPMKLMFASFFFTLPPTMAIMIGPSLILIMHSLTHAGSGG